MTVIPPPIVLKEFLGPTTRHTRRIEIYEQDGITRWEGDTENRLVDGSVTVDYDRNERRVLDNLILENSDGGLINAPHEFWYDKVIKVFRGVRVNEKFRVPRVLVLSDDVAEEQMAQVFRQALVGAGFGDVTVNTLASNYDLQIAPFDIIVGLKNATATQIDRLVQAYRAGKSVFVMDADAANFIIKAYPGSPSTTTPPTEIIPIATSSHPVSKGWSSFASNAIGDTTAYAVSSGEATMIAPISEDSSYSRVTAFQDSVSGGRAVAFSFLVDYRQYDDPSFTDLIVSAARWLNTVRPINVWETQIGEFMIDRISEGHFPRQMKVTGRDYTKKCLTSKFTRATQFDAGLTLESLIGAIASNAGIHRRLIPPTGITIGRAFFFDRGVTRWDAMKEVATAYNYEIYFNATGYLVMRPFRDPATTAPTVWIHTGREGQLASYEKSTTDSRLFNHILVTGESSDANVPPVWAEALNNDPNSPASIDELGDRLYEYNSSFIETTAQAQELANTFLSIYSLEEFELSFESLMLPWLEVGDILGWIDPNRAPGDPDTFLLSSLSIPLKLGPMSGVGKRVTIVS